jgi:hypothetical protein
MKHLGKKGHDVMMSLKPLSQKKKLNTFIGEGHTNIAKFQLVAI